MSLASTVLGKQLTPALNFLSYSFQSDILLAEWHLCRMASGTCLPAVSETACHRSRDRLRPLPASRCVSHAQVALLLCHYLDLSFPGRLPALCHRICCLPMVLFEAQTGRRVSNPGILLDPCPLFFGLHCSWITGRVWDQADSPAVPTVGKDDGKV